MPSGTMTGPSPSCRGSADSLPPDTWAGESPGSNGGRKWKQMAVRLMAR